MAGGATKFLGNTVGEAAAFAAGLAIAPVLHPVVQVLANQAWALDPTKPLDPGLLAEAVAHGHIEEGVGASDAALSGISGRRFAEMVKASHVGPGSASAFVLWRRGKIDEGRFVEALQRDGIEAEWISELKDLKAERLDPPVIALAMVRGIMDDLGLLPVGPPTSTGNVKAFPRSPLSTLQEAEAAGYDEERLRILAAIAGRPIGPEGAAAAFFKGILQRADFDRAISEGDVRNEWAEAILENARAIPSVSDYVNAHLRGWINQRAMYDGTARHGMSRADTDLLYLRTGRPAAPGQMATAAARGIDGPDGTPMDRAQFLKGIAESDIRPEWGPMLWESRFLYPPLFQISRLVSAGAIDAATAAEWATKDRYPPEVVNALKAYWSQGSTATGAKELTVAQLRADYEGGFLDEQAFRRRLKALGYDDASIQQYVTLGEAALVKKYRDAGVTLLNRRYLHHQIDSPTTRTLLGEYGVTAAGVERLLGVWDLQRQTARSELTPAQIKKAYAAAIITRDEAIAELVDREYTAADASTLLDE